MSSTKYPWDSHQSAVINSVELTGPQLYTTGVTHYRHILQTQRTYPRICTDFVKEYRDRAEAPSDTILDLDTSQSTRSSPLDRSINYTTRPAPAARSEYHSDIYHATTTSSAVCLAIVRIAEKNLPFIDFTSAANHLPNLSPSDPLPSLPVGIFTGDLPSSHLPTSTRISIAFLPEFYSDNRHALGYYVLLSAIADTQKERVTAAVFTPCTIADLEDWDMVLYEKGRQAEGIHHMDVVGVRGGRWVTPDCGQYWGSWSWVWWVLERWEKKIAKTLERIVGGV
ncbi:hypothetical protein IAQ61_011628 [Plenodomus lingam]|uniref:Uncharacterized protein n=1 Tax=Leptosphaeria maculans (strain JN3 / isolate v23.1.3 / race Av1-4-5-6-7-8) TaxID=985895 RepID=E5AAM9_LEPMJ|nr:hypothetical protein LEMA_P018500.1 [Plenodomus lingam JN3]KAH9859846.1 hypothetical protein IAQ61_011628 [Plenodomus lingam]CBY00720.1 hypothetical protein LEMA_P018500.1 [Plenodomus lingam JN3]